MALMRASPSGSSSACVRSATASAGSGGSSRPMASARYRRTRGSSSFASSNALTSAGAERAVGADLRVGHQPRQLVRRRPAPVRPAVPHLREVVLRACGRRPAASGSRHTPAPSRQRRPAGSEKTERRGRARRPAGFESRFRARRVCPCNWRKRRGSDRPSACKFYYVCPLAVKDRTCHKRSRLGARASTLELVTSASEPPSRSLEPYRRPALRF